MLEDNPVGTAAEPVRYLGAEQVDQIAHDGRLRPAVGVSNLQVWRANRSRPDYGDGWTYLNAQFLARWRGNLYLSFIVNPVGEHIPPCQSLLTTSPNGVDWAATTVLFPPYSLPDDTPALMHQRMGFYIAPDGRLLALGFYGIPPSPNNGQGVGRVVREIYGPNEFGPIYFLRYNRHAGWHEGNTSYPLYTQSPDQGFQAACNALLADRLVTQQWWEEDRATDGFFSLAGDSVPGFDGKAFCSYRRPDGVVVGLWKWGFAALSGDNGASWSTPVRLPSLVTAGAKVWGQRTADGRYALVYNPTPRNEYRWPLVAISGEDGVHFSAMAVIHGEVPPRRFVGQYKAYGPQYVRGIEADDGSIDDNGLWLTYGSNKEDLWIARVDLPLRTEAAWPVADQFAHFAPGALVPEWSIYSPRWAPVALADEPGGRRCLVLRDADPYDYARATRPFPPQEYLRLACELQVARPGGEGLEIELQDGRGTVALLIHLRPDGQVIAAQGPHTQVLGHYAEGEWMTLVLVCDCQRGQYQVQLADQLPARGQLVNTVSLIERVLFRTGPARLEPTTDTADPLSLSAGADLPAPDDPLPEACYLIASLDITSPADSPAH
jgi:hypothetical protein